MNTRRFSARLRKDQQPPLEPKVHNGWHVASQATVNDATDRRLPGGLRVLPAERALRDRGRRARPLLDVDEVLAAARAARDDGSTRFCMGAAWRQVRDGAEFDRVLEMVRGVRELGLEACCTLGMLSREQAERLAEAGFTAYNHNLDTGPDYYRRIITTRTYDDRLTHPRARARRAGSPSAAAASWAWARAVDDRIAMLGVLARLDPHPESVPINALVRVAGTPLAERPPVDPLDLVRHDRHRAHRHAARASCASRAGRTEMSARDPGALLPRRRQLHLHRRAAAHHAQPRPGPRPGAARAARPPG